MTSHGVGELPLGQTHDARQLPLGELSSLTLKLNFALNGRRNITTPKMA
jgi:hypothetical protein